MQEPSSASRPDLPLPTGKPYRHLDGVVPAPTPARGPTSPPPRPPPSPPPDSNRGWIVLVSALVGIVILLGGFLVLREGDPDGETTTAPTTDPSSPETTAEDGSTEQPTSTATTSQTTSEATVSSTASVPPETASSNRSATLFAGVATLREAPDLDAPTIDQLTNRDGASMTVHGEIQSGWYEVTIDGLQGWIFGAFVLPSDEGYEVAISRDRSRAVVLRTANGSATGEENPSGNKVLLTEVGGDRHEVLMPDGSTRYVRANDVDVVR